ncbi:ATP phosphoribosyltransferase [Brevibacterium sp. 5221]|uniref:ATP phosphoribosyltransferase n=1 Tax=Brevibacterium rongguiense TaxID=2695267 RepID=A0A6N9H925_9MICO|nr:MULTISPECIES: ATP phosphoribosyltransferase [Brevibacterium]MYM20537.1 ATP phosphoribosyltransferase [Brevibacterium rongguiense]WAL40887.1 ATP phosphoribosyltransferase [Brevibacterium sp. BRM-1]
MLRVAVPNKGSLSEAATTMLREAGYALRTSAKSLVHQDTANGVEFFFLRPRDIAVYIGRGILDLGITGRDLLLESESEAVEVLPLGFGRSSFHYAGPAGRFTDPAELDGATIATSYPTLVRADLAARGLSAATVKLDGAVEVSIQLGVADAIADVVETGSTLRAAGLETFGEALLESEGVLIAPAAAQPSRETAAAADILIRRLDSVMVARNYVLIDYDVHESALEAASAVTPGLESPTVSPLQDPEWFAVRSMVEAKAVHEAMDRLYAAGARAILVTNIGACRI